MQFLKYPNYMIFIESFDVGLDCGMVSVAACLTLSVI